MARTTTKSNIFIDGAQAGTTLKDLESKTKRLNNEIKRLAPNSDEYRKKVKELGEASGALNAHRQKIREISDAYNPAKKNINEFGIGMKSAVSGMLPFTGIVGGIVVGVQGLVSGIKSWYTNNKELEKSLSSLKSITGASAQDLKFYEEQAKEIGRTTTLTAVQAVNAFKLIGSARPDLLKNKEALAQVTKEAVILSEAAEMQLEPAAQALAGAMNQFNLGADQSARIINSLAAGSLAGAANIEEISQTMDKAGTAANSAGVSVEQFVASTELLADKNIKASEAGTGLRNFFLSMSAVKGLPKEALDQLEKYGVDIEKVSDSTLPLNERLTEFSKIANDQVALLKVFGKENIVVGQTLLSNVDRYKELEEAVTGTNTAYVQAQINTDNLDGDIKKLSSAWEGLTLSTNAAQSPMRGIVQVGTEVLTWITNLIGLFTEFDSLKAEEILLKLAKGLNYLNPLMWLFGDSVQNALDEMIRMNRMTQETVAGFKKEADAAATLIKIIDNNKKSLKDKNLTTKESNKLSKENEQAIKQLSEKYPDLTKEMDLNKASSQELSKLQKEITENLLNQSIAAVQAAEAERLLAQMVTLSMEIANQRAKEQKRSAVTNFVADIFADDAEDLEEQLTKTQSDLEKLPETMQKVSQQVKGLNLDFGATFQTQTDLISKSMQKIKTLQKEVDMSLVETPRTKALKKQIESEKEVVKVLKAQQEEEKKKALQTEDNSKKTLEAEEAQKKAMEAKAKAAEKARQQFEDLRKTLDDIIARSKELGKSLDYEKQLKAFQDEKLKEIFIAETAVNEKYEKEIESAKKLAKEKGEIGIQATSQLAALEAMKTEELELKKSEIRKKYLDKQMEQLSESFSKQMEKEAEFERAKMDIKVARAYAFMKENENMDATARKNAIENLKQTLIDQAEFETKAKNEALRKQFVDGEILRKDYDQKREENERILNEKIREINTSTQEQVLKIFAERFTSIMDSLKMIVNSAQQLTDAYFNHQKNQIDEETRQSIEAEKQRMDAGLSTREEFELRKQEIEQNADMKRKEIERKKAERSKMLAMFESALNSAVAASKVLANPLLLALTIAAGVAQQALIASTPMPQFFEGGFKNVTGAKDGKTYKAKQVPPLKGGYTPNQPSFALFSEKGPEYFVPNHLLKNAEVANYVGAIEAIRTRQYVDGGFTSAPATSPSDNQIVEFLKANMAMLMALNQKIPNMGVKIGDKQIDDISTRSNELNSFKA
jgi:TP901 family phage tail tape measure protein